MIDLSNAKVGDEFEDANGNHVKIIVADHSASKYVGMGVGTVGGTVFYGIYTKFGDNVDQRSCGLASKHEPRPWLKDMPDADLFNNDVYSITFEMDSKERGNWYCTDIDGGQHWVCTNMPILTGDQWKDSKISINELREWQSEYIGDL